MKKINIPFLAILTFSIAALLTAADYINIIDLPAQVLMAARWIAIVTLISFALIRKSLTTWILVSMVVGAEIGNDFPETAVHLRVLSQIFLRLIKTIIAPLLFGTLVVGIAGHSDLKQVGRMGW